MATHVRLDRLRTHPAVDDILKELLKLQTRDVDLLCLRHAARLSGLSVDALKKARQRGRLTSYYVCCSVHAMLSRDEVLRYAQQSKSRKARQRARALRSPLDDLPGGVEWEETKPAPPRKPLPRSLDDLDGEG